jgi:CIC family chloride channel protein
MTGSYSLLLPTLWVCTLAFLLSDEQSIYSSQVESHTRSPAHQAEFVRGMLTGMSVGQFVKRDDPPPVVHVEDHLDAVLGRMSIDPHGVLPVTDPEGRLLGVVSLEEVYLATQIPDGSSTVLVADLMRSDVVPLQLGDSVDRAMELFCDNDLLELPVVDDSQGNRVVGTISRAEIASTYLRHVQGAGKGSKLVSIERS